jgi:spoIIIJ-associated protein
VSNNVDETVTSKAEPKAAAVPAEPADITLPQATVAVAGVLGADGAGEPETSAGPSTEPGDLDDGDDADEEPGGEFVEDGRADRALDFVVEILTTMGLDCTVDLMENAPEDPATDIRIEISGRDASRLIGRKGQTLAALQFLANRVVNRPSFPRRHILIDADSYRARRESALAEMAQRLGKQAVSEGKIITFEPMSAQDRRIVHLALAKFGGVVTKSEGKGAARRVQIIPVRE